MVMQWYFTLTIVIGGVIVLGTIIFIVFKYRKKRGTKNGYDRLKSSEEQAGKSPSDYHDANLDKRSNGIQKDTPLQDPALHHSIVTNVDERKAEVSSSEIDGFIYSAASAYGDTTSMISVASKASWLSMDTISNLTARVQASLIYSFERMYIAGKVIRVEGLTFERHKLPSHARVHVVILPVKKYAIRTNWYRIDDSGKVNIGEYFKYSFKLPPSESRVMLRMRVYGRMKVGTFGRGYCVGECYITLKEVIDSRGGLTFWRTLSRGVPETISELQ